MKNFTIFSFLSFMIVNLAIASETPKNPGMTIEQMLTLRQMYEDLQKNDSKDFSFRSRLNEICVKNNTNNDEVCIHKIILAEMLLEAYKKYNVEVVEQAETFLNKLKKTNLPELNVNFGTNSTIKDSEKINLEVYTPKRNFDFKAAFHNTNPNTFASVSLRIDGHSETKFDGELNNRRKTWNDFALRIKNLTPEYYLK